LLDLSKARFTPLPGTAEEARALSRIFPSAAVLTREQATKGALQKLSGPSILHIATHGFFLADVASPTSQRSLSRQLVWEQNKSQGNALGTQNPLLRSGLAFAGANARRSGVEDTGIVTAYEGTSLDLLGTKLVVLSACDTGVGEVKVGEGVYGLRRALVIAGAESQVTSLWQVDDVATRDLMVNYYTLLQRGEGRGEALRNAQLNMLKSTDRSHPYYWASFIQLGDWRRIDPGEAKASP
jgi:CHAT domain-containing protein